MEEKVPLIYNSIQNISSGGEALLPLSRSRAVGVSATAGEIFSNKKDTTLGRVIQKDLGKFVFKWSVLDRAKGHAPV